MERTELRVNSSAEPFTVSYNSVKLGVTASLEWLHETSSVSIIGLPIIVQDIEKLPFVRTLEVLLFAVTSIARTEIEIVIWTCYYHQSSIQIKYPTVHVS